MISLKTKIIILILLLPCLAHAEPSRQEVVTAIRETAVRYGVEPAFALAVAQMESGKDLKCGQLNKTRKWNQALFGPMGVRGCFLLTGDMREVVEVGVMALRGTRTEVAKIRRLKAYNPEWRKGNYLNQTMKLYRQYRRRG